MESIRYRVSIDDLVEFSMFCTQNTPALRRARHLRLLVAPAVVLISSLLLYNYDGNVRLSAALAVVAGVTCAINYLTYDFQRRKWLRKLFEKEHSTGREEDCVLSVTSAGFELKSDVSESSCKWDSITDVIVNELYAYLLMGSVQGVVVPREKIIEGEFDLFITSVKKYRKAAG